MRVTWARRATNDLKNIVSYIRRDDPAAAERVATRIVTEVVDLSSMSHRGRIGRADGTRELVFHPWPYIAVYRVVDNQVRILRIRHAAQNWP
jgi:addiction module RelE/StbE family toxin